MDANFFEWIAQAVQTDANFLDWIARSVRTDTNFLERIAPSVRMVSLPVQTANERHTNGYPFKIAGMDSSIRSNSISAHSNS